MYENEIKENVAATEGDLPENVSSGETDMEFSNTVDFSSRSVSGGDAGVDVSGNAADTGQPVSTSEFVSDVVSVSVASGSAYCSCSCGDSSPDLSALEARADKINSLVFLIFLFLILEWTEKKLTAIVRNMSSWRR